LYQSGMDESNVLGPLQNERQYRRVIELVEDAKSRGAKVLLGGAPRGGSGFFYPVSFLSEVTDGMRIVDGYQDRRGLGGSAVFQQIKDVRR
jgi:acyl-CoA reductase-like NAD-dependent aldehyde dehydrogenase